MDRSTLIHITSEVVIVGGMFCLLNKKIKDMEEKIDQISERILIHDKIISSIHNNQMVLQSNRKRQTFQKHKINNDVSSEEELECSDDEYISVKGEKKDLETAKKMNRNVEDDIREELQEIKDMRNSMIFVDDHNSEDMCDKKTDSEKLSESKNSITRESLLGIFSSNFNTVGKADISEIEDSEDKTIKHK